MRITSKHTFAAGVKNCCPPNLFCIWGNKKIISFKSGLYGGWNINSDQKLIFLAEVPFFLRIDFSRTNYGVHLIIYCFAMIEYHCCHITSDIVKTGNHMLWCTFWVKNLFQILRSSWKCHIVDCCFISGL